MGMTMLSAVAIFMMSLQAPAPAPPGAFRTLERGLDSNLDAPRQAVARTAGEWEALWRVHGGERTRPALDFNKEMIVAVFLGSRPTAGFAVEIVGLKDEAGALVVQYRETRPPAGALTAQVLTMPYHIIAAPKRAATIDVKFERLP
jgi:hypothetical protein